MFDIAWSEFLVVAVVALVVVGPKDLPALLRTVGKTVASLRRMAGDFQSQFNEAMREAELDDLKREVTGLKDQATKLVGPNPFQIARDELKSALDDKPAPSALVGEEPASVEAPSALAPAPTPQGAPAMKPIEDKPAVAETPAAAGEAAPKAAKPKSTKSKSTEAKTEASKTEASKSAAPKAAKPKAAKAEPKSSPKPAAEPKAAPKRAKKKAEDAAEPGTPTPGASA